jgi:glyoxylase-like metal-dependent hydrolase (beta-lactamase superfamily II)
MTDPDETVPVEQLTFTEASRELDAIVNFFEQREVDVDVLVGRLERATALIEELDQRRREGVMMVDRNVPPTGHGSDDRLYFRQLLSGRDFAKGDMMARQMVNFVYLIGDRETGEAVAVDPAYAVQDLLDILAADDMELTGVLGTHFHPDHLGGQMGGWSLEGISTLLEKVQVPIHVQADEVPWVEGTTGVGAADLVAHHSGDSLQVGDVTIEMIHTPGHTPGSQCFLVDGRLVAGDTLFLEGCGRTDFPGSDPLAMYESIHTRLARVPDEAILFPGHLYSQDPSQSMGETRRWNYVFRPRSAQEWMTMFGS